MHSSYTEANGLWSLLSNYWSLQGLNKKPINLTWQGMYEATLQLKSKEDRIADYSIERMPYSKAELWVDIPIEQNYDIGSDVISIPTITDGVNNPSTVYSEDVDYTVTAGIINWTSLPDPDNGFLIAPQVLRENDLMESYFVDGYLDLDLSGYTAEQKKHIIRLLWNILKIGPTTANIESVINALAGMPFMRYHGIPVMTTSDSSNKHLIPVSTYRDDDIKIVFLTKKEISITIADSKFISTDVDINDILYIGVEYYTIIDNDGTSHILSGDVADGTYSATAYVVPNWPVTTYLNSVILDQDTNNIYYYRNGVISDLPTGEHDNMLFGHREVIRQKILGNTTNNVDDLIDDIPRTTSSYEGYYVDGEPFMLPGGDQFMVGTLISGIVSPQFTPIQKLYRIFTWYDIDSDEVSVINNDILNNKYNGEINNPYHIFNINNTEISLYGSSEIGRLGIGDYVRIKRIARREQDVLEIKYSDSKWMVKVSSQYSYRYGQDIHIIQSYLSGTSTIHRGGAFVVIDGAYNDGFYWLTVNGDLSDINTGFTSGILMVDDGAGGYEEYWVDGKPFYVVGSCNTQVSIVECISTTTKINDTSGTTIEVGGVDSDSINELPILMKSSYGNYGDGVVKDVSGVVGAVISIAEDVSDNRGQYLVLKDDYNPGSIYKIIGRELIREILMVDDGAGGTEEFWADGEPVYVIKETQLTLDRVSDYDYTLSTLKAIFIKTLPYHNGFMIKLNGAVNEDDLADILSAIVAIHPNYVDNINKILTLLMPGANKYEWDYGIRREPEDVIVYNDFGNPVKTGTTMVTK